MCEGEEVRGTLAEATLRRHHVLRSLRADERSKLEESEETFGPDSTKRADGVSREEKPQPQEVKAEPNRKSVVSFSSG